MGRRAFYAEGTLAERPPARRQGLMYEATDEGVVYIDDGTNWVPMKAAQELPPGHIVWDQFVPGTLSARNPISVIANPVGAQVVLRYLEANLGQAPSTVDASNNLVLDVFGSVSGLAELPLDVNGQSRFAWPPVTEQGGMDTSSSFTSSNNARGMALAFTVNTPIRVTQFQFNLESDMAEARRLLGLLDADCNWLSYVETTEAIAQAVSWSLLSPLYTLPEPVLLETGTRYHFGLIAPDGGRAYARRSRGTGVGVVHYSTDANGDFGVFVHHTAPAGITFADAHASGQRNTSWYDGSSPTYGRTNDLLPNFTLFGTSPLPSLDGDIHLALSSVGTPGASPGADLNITLRAELPA